MDEEKMMDDAYHKVLKFSDEKNTINMIICPTASYEFAERLLRQFDNMKQEGRIRGTFMVSTQVIGTMTLTIGEIDELHKRAHAMQDERNKKK